MADNNIFITFAVSKETRSRTLKPKAKMPTRKEAEAYLDLLQKEMVEIEDSTLPERIKEELINIYLDKWKTTHEALLGIGIPLEDED